MGLDHHVLLCKVRLVGAWIKRREVVDRPRMIISEKLVEHKYRMVENAREVCSGMTR